MDKCPEEGEGADVECRLAVEEVEDFVAELLGDAGEGWVVEGGWRIGYFEGGGEREGEDMEAELGGQVE